MSLRSKLLIGLCLPVFAQHFGQNKFQTERSHWKKVQTQHFDIYYDQHGDSLAKWTVQNVEKAYGQVSEVLGHKLYQRVPLILHNSPAHFRSTNVIPEELPEAVGGFTEIFQNRIVLPFDGSYNEFRHVLQHEMVHAMIFDLFKGESGSGGMRLAVKMNHIPLWFSEGLAEFASMGPNIESEPYLMDGISFGYLSPPSDNLQGFMAYRGGQNFLIFLEENYGRGTVKKIIQSLHQGMSIEDALGKNTGTTSEELGEIWLRELRRIHWPELGQRSYAKEFAHALTKAEQDQSYVNLSPALSPDGKWIAFGSDQGGFEGIYAAELDSTGRIKESFPLIQSAWSADHESVHLFNSSYSWSPDSKRLVVVSQNRGKDELQIIQVKGAKTLDRYALDMDLIRNPHWSPQGDQIVFAGLQSGQMDLYLLDLKSRSTRKLTQGADCEDHPQLSADGKKVLYESNAGFHFDGIGMGQKEVKQIHLLDLESGQDQVLSQGPWSHESPTWGPGQGNISYLSNQSGLNNLYSQNLSTGTVEQLTNVLSQVNSYSWDAQGQKLAFSLFEGGMFQLYLSDSVPTQQSSKHQSLFAQWLNGGMQGPLFSPKNRKLEAWKESSPTKDSCDLIQSDSLRKQCSAKGWNSDWLSQDSLIQKQNATRSQVLRDSLWASELPTALDSLGRLKPQAYKPLWSLNQMWLAAGGGYAGPNRYSIGGEAYAHFSDLMGDQGLTAMLYGAGSDWRAISAFLRYEYLPYTNDFYASTWYTPNRSSSTVFLDSNSHYLRGDAYTSKVEHKQLSLRLVRNSGQVFDSIVPTCIWYEKGMAVDTTLAGSTGMCSRSESYFDQDFGLNLGLSHPFSRFSRVDLSWGISSVRRSKQDLVCTDLYCESLDYQDSPSAALNLPRTQISMEWDFDNSRWGWTGPLAGSRAYGSARWVHSLDGTDHYGILSADARHYFYLGHAFSIATRAAGGVSQALAQGQNPYVFFAGGDDFFDLNYSQPDWLNTKGTLRESYSSEITTPLRGFPYYHFRGDRYALVNAELRFPLIEEIRLGFLPMSLGGIMGNVFYDAGGAWSHGNALDQMAWSWGYGWRVNLGVFVLRYTKAYGRYFSYANKTEQSHISLGADF